MLNEECARIDKSPYLATIGDMKAYLRPALLTGLLLRSSMTKFDPKILLRGAELLEQVADRAADALRQEGVIDAEGRFLSPDDAPANIRVRRIWR